MSVNLAFLRIPLYALKRLERIEAFEGLSSEDLQLLREEFSTDEYNGLIAALLHAEAHPQCDLVSLMPELPFSNAQIHTFLCKWLRSSTASPSQVLPRSSI